MLALEQRVAPLLAKGQPIPARLTRLRLYSATWLLHQFKTAPEAELLERCDPEALPAAAPRLNAAAKGAGGPGAAGDGKRKLGERAKKELGRG